MGMLRVSVICDAETYVTDIPAANLDSALRAFEEYAGPDLSADSCAAVAAEADRDGDAYLVCVGALWLFLRTSDIEHVMNRERMTTIVEAGGIAVLTVTTAREGDWRFRLHEMPRWPASVRPTNPDGQRRRRWR